MSVALCDRLRGPEVNVQLGFCGLRNRQVSQTFLGRPLRVKRRPSGAANLGLFNPQRRTSEDCRSTSEKCHEPTSGGGVSLTSYPQAPCARARHSDHPKRLVL